MSKKKNSVVIPKSLDEAFAILDQMTSEEEKQAIIDGDDCHFGLGLWIRNNWFHDADCSDLIADIQRAEDGEDIVIRDPDGKVLFMGGGDMFSSSLIDLYREHLSISAFDIDYEESVFHIFGIPADIDMEKLCSDAGRFCSEEDGYSGVIRSFLEEDDQDSTPEDSEKPEIYTAILLGSSAQGVTATYFRASEGAHLHLTLPCFGSPGDVKLAFALMQELMDRYPSAQIFYNDNIDDGQFALVEENFDAMVQLRLSNLASLIEASTGGKHPVISGFQYDFVIPCPDDNPEKNIDDLTIESMGTFIELQWNYSDIFRASKANVTTPDGEEYIMRILTNSEDTFVGTCQHIALYGKEDKVKDVKLIDFLSYMEGNPYFERIDSLQFILRKMPAKEWTSLFNSVEGDLIG